MLAAKYRLRESGQFTYTVKNGVTVANDLVVMHLAPNPEPPGCSRVGFVVSKRVGNAVVRNRVKRQLRHLMKELIANVPGSQLVVVRAKPKASHPSANLAAAIDSAWPKLLTKAGLAC